MKSMLVSASTFALSVAVASPGLAQYRGTCSWSDTWSHVPGCETEDRDPAVSYAPTDDGGGDGCGDDCGDGCGDDCGDDSSASASFGPDWIYLDDLQGFDLV